VFYVFFASLQSLPARPAPLFYMSTAYAENSPFNGEQWKMADNDPLSAANELLVIANGLLLKAKEALARVFGVLF
jgi:hypothetical protein